MEITLLDGEQAWTSILNLKSGNKFAALNLSSCVLYVFSAVALRGRPMHRSGGKRSICERSRMLSPAGHSPGTPLLRCFSNPLLRFRCRFRSQPGSSRAKTFALPVVELPVVDLGNGYQEWGSTSSSSKRNLLFQNPDQPWLLLCGEVFTGISLRILHHVKPEINRG